MAHKKITFEGKAKLAEISFKDFEKKLIGSKTTLAQLLEQKKLVNSANLIAKKCFDSAQEAHLPTNERVFIKFINKVNKYFPFTDLSGKNRSKRGFKARYKEFKSMIEIPKLPAVPKATPKNLWA